MQGRGPRELASSIGNADPASASLSSTLAVGLGVRILDVVPPMVLMHSQVRGVLIGKHVGSQDLVFLIDFMYLAPRGTGIFLKSPGPLPMRHCSG